MVLRINATDAIFASNYSKKINKKHNNNNNNNVIENPIDNELKGIPKSYITFKANNDNNNLKLTDDAKELINQAKEIAKQYGHDEILPEHIIDAEIKNTISKVKELNGKRVNADDLINISGFTKFAAQYSNKNMLSEPDNTKFFFELLNSLNEENKAGLDSIPKGDTNGKIELSENMVERNKKMDSPYVDSYIILGVALDSISNTGKRYAIEFLNDLSDYSHFKTFNEIQKDYSPEFDSRAIEVWNKLALGSSVNVSYDDRKEADRLTASLFNTVDKCKHGNYNADNTVFYITSDTVNDEILLNEINDIKKNDPNVKNIIIANMDQLLVNSNKTDDNNELTGVIRLSQILSNKDENVKLVLLYSNEFLEKLKQDPTMGSLIKNYLSYSVPPIQAYEAKEIITNDMLKDIKTPFSKEARERAIFHAAKMNGVFPDKAVDLMKRISSYYGSEKETINVSDVDEFAQIAYELFDNDSQKQNIIYDTGKTLDKMYGKETTKKDIEAIIRQIKTGNIGTRGIVIYSYDPEAGSGRKYTAETIAGEAKVPFLSINSADYASSERDEDNRIVQTPKYAIKKVFENAKKAARQNPYKTAILYINNFEEFAFSSPYLPGYKQAMSQLSTEMEKAVNEDVNILVIGSTDEYYADAIPLVARDFNQSIVVDSPAFNKKSRREIIENRIKDTKLPIKYAKNDKNYTLDKLVKMTEFMSFVDIKSLIYKTKQIMYERNKEKAGIGEFIEAYLQLSTGSRTSHPEMTEYNKRTTTSHECGHATNLEVMGDILERKGEPWHQSHEVNFITLDPRGNFLGAVFENRKDNADLPFEALFTSIVCAYGGYSCEKAFFNMDGSSGIKSDLAQATEAANRGVEDYGLGYNTGKISNAIDIKSGKYHENVFKDMDVILTNAQIVSDMITDGYKEFNKWFTNKFAKLIGTDECMVDGDEFRNALNKWKNSLSKEKKADLEIMDDIIMDVIKATKNGQKYYQIKRVL